jgi:hypothetical protein
LTTPCYLVGEHALRECHGLEKNLGFSRNTSKLQARVCVECGYVMLFAQRPGVFRAEAERRLRGGSALPLPSGLESPDDLGDLPIASAAPAEEPKEQAR